MENAAFLTEPKIDTSPNSLSALAARLMKDNISFDNYYTHILLVDCHNMLIALAAEKRRDAELVRELVEALERILNPSPGVAKLPPWVYGIAGAAIAKARARGDTK